MNQQQQINDTKVLNELHFEYSRAFPSSRVLELQGSAVLILKQRLQEIKNYPHRYTHQLYQQQQKQVSKTAINSKGCNIQKKLFDNQPLPFHSKISSNLLSNPTEILQNHLVLEDLFQKEFNRYEFLQKKFPSGREYKNWKKEQPLIELKIIMYKCLRNKALRGEIDGKELHAVCKKVIERRIKSSRKPFELSLKDKLNLDNIKGGMGCKRIFKFSPSKLKQVVNYDEINLNLNDAFSNVNLGSQCTDEQDVEGFNESDDEGFSLAKNDVKISVDVNTRKTPLQQLKKKSSNDTDSITLSSSNSVTCSSNPLKIESNLLKKVEIYSLKEKLFAKQDGSSNSSRFLDQLGEKHHGSKIDTAELNDALYRIQVSKCEKSPEFDFLENERRHIRSQNFNEGLSDYNLKNSYLCHEFTVGNCGKKSLNISEATEINRFFGEEDTSFEILEKNEKKIKDYVEGNFILKKTINKNLNCNSSNSAQRNLNKVNIADSIWASIYGFIWSRK
ncbi:hypothetical protein HK099_006787 [Clydaea vesicula]|uniref:Uncharacterized protein n=1 Tax=Clydaea vesicula TaxID=447962 RepID=A0AAD5XU29_9FUNG|nr:hypothetical protein HK099_006787 [Clydaea vesicula]KAJ3387874.1 hypothetical protein HDU92_001762 [Lobulomyces angularis]